MPNIKRLLIGAAIFIIGYFYMIITQKIIPPMIFHARTTGEVTLNNTTAGIIWIGLIITWVLAIIVVPIGLQITGITGQNKEENPVFLGTFGILWGLFAIAISYLTWYWHTGLTSILADATYGTAGIVTALYWTGYITMFLMNVIVIPTTSIIKAKAS